MFAIIEKRREELGFTVNIGISSTRFLAKMASDFEKPDRVHTLFPSEIPTKLWPLPVTDMLFCGASTANKLQRLGIYTVGQLAAADPHVLREHLGKHGLSLWRLAHGEDHSEVTIETEPNKGFSNSTTTETDIVDAEHARRVLLLLSEKVSRRLRADHAKAEVLSVTLRTNDMADHSHQMRLAHPTDITSEIFQQAFSLFESRWKGEPLRHLAVQASRVIYDEEARQIGLMDDFTNEKRQEKADRAVDAIRVKFGLEAVQRASLVVRK